MSKANLSHATYSRHIAKIAEERRAEIHAAMQEDDERRDARNLELSDDERRVREWVRATSQTRPGTD